MSDVLKRLTECNSGMGVRNPDDYSFFMSVTEANEVADKIAELKSENERLKEILTPDCGGNTGNAVNETGWFINDWLIARGDVSGNQFNHLKEMFCESVKFYVSNMNS